MPLMPNATRTRAPALHARYPQDERTVAVRLPPNVAYGAGQVLAEAGNVAAQNEVQTVTITGTPTGGTFLLTAPYRGATAAIAYNATASAVQTALEAVIGAGNVTVTGGPGPGTPYVLTFGGEYGNRDVAVFAATGSFTGGTSPAVATAETTKGSAGSTEVMVAVNDAASDGTQIPKGILLYDVQTDDRGCVVNEWGMNGNNITTPMSIAGEYQCKKLIGLVANHVLEGNAKKFGRLTSGNAVTDVQAVIKIGV